MSKHQIVDALENRRLLSGVSPDINPPLTEYAGIAQQVRIAYLPNLTVSHLASLRATICWGDGTQSPAKFDRNKNGGIDVIATHQFIQPGTFAVSAHLYGTSSVILPPFDAPLDVDMGSLFNVVNVLPAPPRVTIAINQSATTQLAAFYDGQTGISFTAKINWGDTGNKSAGTFVNSQGNWTVFGTHTYTEPGTYIVHAYVYPHINGVSLNTPPLDFATEITVV